MKTLLALTLLCACSVDVIDDNDASVGTKQKCATSNAQYDVRFHYLGGDCDNNDAEGTLNVDINGRLVFPTNCTDHSEYDTCTTYLNETCHTWAWQEQISGQIDWSEDGAFAQSIETLAAFNNSDGTPFCTAQYQVTYVRTIVFAD